MLAKYILIFLILEEIFSVESMTIFIVLFLLSIIFIVMIEITTIVIFFIGIQALRPRKEMFDGIVSDIRSILFVFSLFLDMAKKSQVKDEKWI